MYKLKLHKNLKPDKWQKFSIKQRELMIANELNRAKNWIEKKDLEEVKNCYERALELLDLTIAITKNKNRLREYLRLREMMGKFYIEKKGNLSPKGIVAFEGVDFKFNSQLFTCLCTLSKEVG